MNKTIYQLAGLSWSTKFITRGRFIDLRPSQDEQFAVEIASPGDSFHAAANWQNRYIRACRDVSFMSIAAGSDTRGSPDGVSKAIAGISPF